VRKSPPTRSDKGNQLPDKPDTKRGRKPRRDWKPKFLKALEHSGNIKGSCESAGISRQTAYVARKEDGVFAVAWDEALETACDDMEGEAFRRGVKGVKKAVYYRGRVCGHITKYSARF